MQQARRCACAHTHACMPALHARTHTRARATLCMYMDVSHCHGAQYLRVSGCGGGLLAQRGAAAAHRLHRRLGRQVDARVVAGQESVRNTRKGITGQGGKEGQISPICHQPLSGAQPTDRPISLPTGCNLYKSSCTVPHDRTPGWWPVPHLCVCGGGRAGAGPCMQAHAQCT